MTTLISHCHIYEALYLKTEQLEQEEWKQAVKNLTSALVKLYAFILRFLGSAIRTYQQSAIVRAGHAIINSHNMIGFPEEFQTLEKNVVTEVDICDRIYTRRSQASSTEQIQELKGFLKDMQAPILRTDFGVATLCQKLERSERQKILEWISGIPYRENHDFARRGRTSGTGEWLLRNKRYREWRASSASMILWLHGDRECHHVHVLHRIFLTWSHR